MSEKKKKKKLGVILNTECECIWKMLIWFLNQWGGCIILFPKSNQNPGILGKEHIRKTFTEW